MKTVGIVAAIAGELRPLVAGWGAAQLAGLRQGDRAWQGELAGTRCIAVCAGMGRDAAARACSAISSATKEAGDLQAMFSVGWAGALSCGVGPGEAYALNEVIDAATGERFSTSTAAPKHPLRLVTLDHVAMVTEKRRLAESYAAVLVDMEAATVARLARGMHVSFFCIKAVSDGQSDLLPDFSRFIDAGGKLRMTGLLCHVAARPNYWRSLDRLRRNARPGAEAVAAAVRQMIESGDYADTTAGR